MSNNGNVMSEVNRYNSYIYFKKKAQGAREMAEAFLSLADDILSLAEKSEAWGVAQDYIGVEARERANNFLRLAELFEQKAKSVIETDYDEDYETPYCPVCQRTSKLKVSAKGIREWQNGMYIQDAFPNLTASQRELLKTGIHEECWDILFAEKC